MKAFTVYQPYAHAIVTGMKHYETRPRRTSVRGRVAVHAGKLDTVQATKRLSDRAFWELMGAVGGKQSYTAARWLEPWKSSIAYPWKRSWKA